MRAALALVLALLAVPALGAPRESRGAAAGQFDLYLLALSWSPGFCEAGGGRDSGEQCADGANLGFVVHGLWPQYERGYPSFCQPEGRGPRRDDLDIVAGIVPTQNLARNEWRKHGTCTGLAPRDYFKVIETLWSRLVIPEAYKGEVAEMIASPLEIERAFSAANRGLRPDMMSVDCGRGDGRTILREVRLCITRDLRSFRTCPDEVERDTCRSPAITISAPR